MPRSSGISSRNIKPRSCSDGSSATSIEKNFCPDAVSAASLTMCTGSRIARESAPAGASAAAKAISASDNATSAART